MADDRAQPLPDQGPTPAPTTVPPPERSVGRFIDPQGRSTILQIGRRSRPLEDLYHSWLVATWRRVMLFFVLAYFSINAVFASVYLWLGDAIESAEAHSFKDAFFFSVQTFATIGYGKMVPKTTAANLVVTFESLVGLVCTALMTGLLFAKFSRPTARVLWSEKLAFGMLDGIPSIMFRMANERGNQVVEATLRFMLVKGERTVEGADVRRVYDLPLQRAQSGVFALSWMAVHRVVPGSPLFGASLATLQAAKAELVATLTGLDSSFAQSIHSRHGWTMGEVAVGARYQDILRVDEETGQRVMDFTRFHLTNPVPEAEKLALGRVLLP
ncbi:MAG: ATP-sensitive inward rectifier potassium channel 10 [Deltaproteobacteria bacterium]|nr:ATP-sensitive inward rectifier potassium channel 10 [Deltaproteobacteria bacterium]